MKLFTEAKGYASVANAEKALVKALAIGGETLDSVRWMVAVNAEGRFVPVVMASHHPEKTANLIGIIHVSNVAVA